MKVFMMMMRFSFFSELSLYINCKNSSLGSEVLRQLTSQAFTPYVTHAHVIVLLLKHNAFVFAIMT